MRKHDRLVQLGTGIDRIYSLESVRTPLGAKLILHAQDRYHLYPTETGESHWGGCTIRWTQEAGVSGADVEVPREYLAILPILLAVAMPAWILVAWRRDRRTRAGYCISCGYDLWASMERCPECGTKIAGRAPFEWPAAGLRPPKKTAILSSIKSTK